MKAYQDLSDDYTKTLLENINVGVLSTVDADGAPYGVPINFVTIDGSIFFHGGMGGEKMENLGRDPRCCLTVTWFRGYERTGDSCCNTTTLYQSAVVRGTARAVTDRGRKREVLRELSDKIVPERNADPMDDRIVDITTVMEIVPESVTGRCRNHDPSKKAYRLDMA